MAHSTPLVSQLNTNPGAAGRLALLAFTLLTPLAHAQLPDGPGQSETERICSQCQPDGLTRRKGN
jgi:hypothetical protein